MGRVEGLKQGLVSPLFAGISRKPTFKFPGENPFELKVPSARGKISVRKKTPKSSLNFIRYNYRKMR